MSAVRKVPPAKIDMARVRAELREREEREANERKMLDALRAQEQIRADALKPEGGWWRKTTKGGPHDTLRRAPVIEAISVGCSTAQIMRASGASFAMVHSAVWGARKNPDEIDAARYWPDILRAAREAGLSAAQVAREHGVCYGAVSQACRKHGLPLSSERKDRWTADEDERLRADYKRAATSVLVEQMGRSKWSIWKRAKKLGLTRVSA